MTNYIFVLMFLFPTGQEKPMEAYPNATGCATRMEQLAAKYPIQKDFFRCDEVRMQH